MRTVTVGNVQILPLLDTRLLGSPELFMPKHAEQFRSEYPHLFDERGLLQLSVTCFLVRSAGQTWLIDTGLGNRRRPNFPLGRLDEALRDAGVRPDEIDHVVHTHLHVDHVGWNTVDGQHGPEPYFPKAEFHVQRAEWDFWMQPQFLESGEHPHLRECVKPIENRVRLHEGEESLDEHLVFVATPGHTPGHVSIGIASGGERAVIIGDVSHHPVQLDHPDWSPVFDVDPEQASRTRARMFDWAAEEQRIWLAGHWPDSGVGRILRVNGKRTFRAL